MNNSIALAGTVLLEAYWESRKKDMLDLITPFVQYCVATTTSLNSIIDVTRVTALVRSNFGYSDIPSSVIKKVLNRDKEHFKKVNGNYRFAKDLDNIVERLEKRRDECVHKIDYIGNALLQYLKPRCHKTKIETKEQCVELLHQFFSSFALQDRLETLDSECISRKFDETNYYIAEYIYDKREEKSADYCTIIELTKGFLLRSAIYLQIDNNDIVKKAYKNIVIVYDTPFILQLLGYQSEEEKDSAIVLHNLLRNQGAKAFFFPQAEDELISILTAYQYSLTGFSKYNYRTLEGLDSKGYSFDSVVRLKKSVVNILKEKYGVEKCDIPSYDVTEKGVVDLSKIDIPQIDAMDYVRNHTRHYKEDNLESDVLSALGIHRMRNGQVSQSIEDCKALFVTTNVDFTRAFNAFYKEKVGNKGIMPVITAFDLSAIAWVKGGKIDSNIPERQLLTNSYLAMQPAPEIMAKCRSELSRLVDEGKITEEEALTLRSDRVTQKELWIEYFPDVDSIGENYIKKLQEKQKHHYIREEESKIEKRTRQDDNDRLRNRIKHEAREYASEKRRQFVRKWRMATVIILTILTMGSVVGLIVSFSSTKVTIPLALFGCVSVLSIVDTIKSKSFLIGRFIEKVSYSYEARVEEKKLQEYKRIQE